MPTDAVRTDEIAAPHQAADGPGSRPPVRPKLGGEIRDEGMAQ